MTSNVREALSPRSAAVARAVAMVLATGVLLGSAANVRAESVGHVAVLHHDGSAYEGSPTVPNSAPRERASREFFSAHRDAYDFLIVFPAFSFDLAWNQAEIGGLHTPVRNDVTGTGRPVGLFTGSFGSNARLKAYIDINTLVPGHPQASLDQSIVYIAHEVAHQWSGQALYRDAGGASSSGLLGQDGAHWSYFLSSQASVLYGSDWKTSGSGQFSATGSMLRYSDLDLYLMGLLPPSEVAPFTLIRPAAGSTAVATDLPPPNGAMLSGTAEAITIGQVIGASGPRLPAASTSQRTFRAAFAILVGPGQSPTAEQVAFVDAVRRQWSNQFFFMTRGQSVMETDLVEQPPVASAGSPAVRAGVAYLVGAQQANGAWADDPTTTARETQEAIQALLLAPGSPGVATALAGARDFLLGLSAGDSDTAARQARALSSLVGSSGSLPLLNPDGGVGLAPGYGSSVIDSVLVGLGAQALGGQWSGSYVEALTGYVLSQQNVDGGWPWLADGPSRVEATSWALRLLEAAPRSSQVQLSAQNAASFMVRAQGMDGLFGDEYPTVAATSEALLALSSWRALDPASSDTSSQALLALQSADGSWDGEAHATALAVQALGTVALLNLSVSPLDISVSRSRVTDGEIVVASVTIRNEGRGVARDVALRLVDSLGVPFAADQLIPTIAAGDRATLAVSLDTTNHGGSSQLFVVVDPSALQDEIRRDDNRAAAELVVAPSPASSDPYVVAGSLVASPPEVDRLPVGITFAAMVGNAGQTDCAARLTLLARGVQVGSVDVALQARQRRIIQFPSTVPPGATGDIPLELRVTALAPSVDVESQNNSATSVLRVVPSVDIAVANVSATPALVSQGENVLLAYTLSNSGTLDALGVTATIRVIDTTGREVAILTGTPVNVGSGGTLPASVTWKAAAIGHFSASVVAAHLQDRMPGNNGGSVSFEVQPSQLPNLAFEPLSLKVLPDPAFEGGSTTVTARLLNTGVTQASSAVVDVFLGDPVHGGTRLARQMLGPIAPGGHQDLSQSFQVNEARAQSLVLVADPDNAVAEFEESDNSAAVTVEVKSKADLVVTDGAIAVVSPSIRPGQQIPIDVLVVNAGGQDSLATTLELSAFTPDGVTTLIESRPVPVIAAGSSTQLHFTWTAASAGVTRLVAVVNPSRSTFESRFDNNRGEKALAALDTPVALSNPFFSPNGDGIKDTTTIFYRWLIPSDVRIEIFDRRGLLVRGMAGGDGPTGALEWDGRNDSGGLARDGRYRVVARTTSPSGGVLGEAEVVVDTNMLPLTEVADSGLLETSALIDRAVTPDLGAWAVMPDGSGVVAGGWDGKTYIDGPGFWFVSAQGDPPALIADGGYWDRYRPQDMSIERDGSFFVFNADDTWAYSSEGWIGVGWGGGRNAANTLELVGIGLPAASHGSQILARGERDEAVRARRGSSQPENSPSGKSIERPVALSPDGKQVAFGTSELICTGAIWTNDLNCHRSWAVEVMGTNGSNRRVVAEIGDTPGPQRNRFFGYVGSLSFSPDGQTLVAAKSLDLVRAGPALLSIDLQSGSQSEFNPAIQSFGRANQRPQWLESTSELVFYAPDGRFVGLDVVTGGTRTIASLDPLAGFLYQFLLAPTEDAILVNTDTALLSVSVGNSSMQTVRGPLWSPQDNSLHWGNLDWGQAATELYFGYSGETTLRSLANMTARIGVTRNLDNGTARFTGTASDLNLETWEIRVVVPGSGEERTIARGDASVVHGIFVEWVPPIDGIYETVLAVVDKAGNHVERRARFGWGGAAQVANIAVSPEFISPNGDGVQDAAKVTFSASAPTTVVATVARADGTVVRSLSQTAIQAGDHALAWDGTDDTHVLLPDGDYQVKVGDQLFRVVIDTVPPDVRLFTGRSVTGGGQDHPFKFTNAMAAEVDCLGNTPSYPMPVPDVPEIRFQFAHAAHDHNLDEWVLERGAPDTGWEVVVKGTDQLDNIRELSFLYAKGGQYRLTARDRAGNRAETTSIGVAPDLFIVGLSPSEALQYGCALGVTQPGRQRGMVYSVSDIALGGRTNAYRIVGGMYAYLPVDPGTPTKVLIPESPLKTPILTSEQLRSIMESQLVVIINDTIDEPVVRWAVAYQDWEAIRPVQFDYDVQLVPAWGLLWTPPPGYGVGVKIEAIAEGLSGRLYESQTVSLGKQNADPATVVDACLQLAPAESVRVTIPVPLDAETGAPVELASVTVSVQRPAAVGVPAAEVRNVAFDRPGPPGPRVSVTVPTSDLPECRYQLQVTATLAGGEVRHFFNGVNLCGSWIDRIDRNGSDAWLTIKENHRKPVTNVDVLAPRSPVEMVRVVSTGAFSGVTPPLQAATGAVLRCQDILPSLKTTLADGSVPDQSGFTLCDQKPSVLRLGCADVNLALVRSDAPVCSYGQPLYSVRLTGTDGRGFTGLTLEIQRPNGAPVRPLAVSGTFLGSTMDVTATFDVQGLAPGLYQVAAVVSDPDGVAARPTAAFTVNRTPPSLTMNAPTSGQLVCPTTDPIHPDRRELSVLGQVTGVSLERLDFRLRTDDGFTSLQSKSAAASAIVLATLDVTGWKSANYHLFVSAVDASGGSVCTPETVFHLAASAALSDLAADQGTFSPDQDGLRDTLGIPFSIDEPADVTLRAVGADGVARVAASYPVGAGAAEVWWDGRFMDGLPVVDGTYLLELEARDGCGNTSTSRTSADVDTTPPLVRIDGPTDGAAVGSTFVLMGEVSDRHLETYRVEWGAGLSPPTFTQASEGYQSTSGALGLVSLAGQPPGIYTVQVVATDTVGHVMVTVIHVELTSAQLLMSFVVAPQALSPNGDGVQDFAAASVELLRPAVVSLTLLDLAGTPLSSLAASQPLSGGVTVLPLDQLALGAIPDGSYRVLVSAWDAGTSDQVIQPFEVDRVKPVVEVTSPAAGAVVRGPVTIAARIADPLLSRWRAVVVGPDGREQVVASGVDAVAGPLALRDLPDGRYELRVHAEDRAGNSRDQATSFTVDGARPRVALASPTPGQYLTSARDPVVVRGLVQDANLSRWRLELDRAGVRRELVSGTTAVDGMLTAWSLAAEPDGPVLLVLTAEDLAGNMDASSMEVWLDSTPPVAHLVSPRDAFLKSATVVRGTAADDHLTAWKLEIAQGTSATAVFFTEIGGGASSVNDVCLAELAVLPGEGTFTIRLTASDQAGNVGTDMAPFTIDTAPPVAPVGLAVVLRRPADAILTWTPSSDPDLAGYQVLRASATGPLRVYSGLVSGTTYEDLTLADATYRYAVAAVDQAGNVSASSAETSLVVDTAPPSVAIASPRAGDAVAGIVSVTGTAYSGADFKEYRLSVGAGDVPASFSLLKRGTAKVLRSELAAWDTRSLPQDSIHTLRLEAEDSIGNTAEARVTVRVDNTPPAAVVLLSAQPQSDGVLVTWRAAGETDLAGYVLYRDSAPVNAPGGADLSDPRPFLLPVGTTTYNDAPLADGVYTYRVQAFDRALNPSPLSNALTVTLDRRAPAVTIESPANLARISGVTPVVATVVDADVTLVRLEARPAGDGPFTTILEAGVGPFVASLDPAAFASNIIEVRALATDRAGQVTTAPQSIYLLIGGSLAPPVASTLTNEDRVQVSWSDPNPGSPFVAYAVVRDYTNVADAGLPTGVATSSSVAAGYPAGRAFDGLPNTSWRSAAGAPQTWSVTLGRPALTTSIDYVLDFDATFDLLVKVKGSWLPLARGLAGTMGYGSYYLDPPMALDEVKLAFTATPAGRAGLIDVNLNWVPSVPAAPAVEQGLGEGSYTYEITGYDAFGTSATTSASAHVYKPYLWANEWVTGTSPGMLSGQADANATVSILRGGAASQTAIADGQGAYLATIPLLQGDNVFSAQAVDPAGNRSMVSDPTTITFDPPPQVLVALSLVGTGPDSVALGVAVSGDLARLSTLEVHRGSPGSNIVVGRLPADARTFNEAGLANGTYSYFVRPLTLNGIAGTLSNTVQATLAGASLSPPTSLLVTVPDAPGALALSWSYAGPPGTTFVVERSSMSGPFSEIHPPIPATGLSSRDVGLQAGVEYAYRIRAMDGSGNASAPSNLASGSPRAPLLAVPKIDGPTVTGTPIVLATTRSTVTGYTLDRTGIDLRQNGRFGGSGAADQLAIATRPLPGAPSGATAVATNVTGERIAYSHQGLAGGTVIAVLDVTTGAELSSVDVGSLRVTTLALSTDGARVAMGACDDSAATCQVYLADPVTSTIEPLTVAYRGDETQPAWAPDGRSVSYRASRGGQEYLAVAAVETRVERLLLANPSSTGQWVSSRRLLVVGGLPAGTMALQSLDPVTGEATSLFESDGLPAFASAPLAGQVVVTAASSGSTRLWLVGLHGDAPEDLGPTNAFGELALSPQGDAAVELSLWDIAYFRHGGAAADPVQAPTSLAGSKLLWTSQGLIAVSPMSGTMVWVDASYRFSIPVSLDAGRNLFSALSVMNDGSQGGLSEAIEVTRDAGNQPDLELTASLEPSIPITTDPVSALVTVANTGTALAGSAHLVASLGRPDGSTVALPSVAVRALAPGERVVLVLPLDVGGQAGRFDLGAAVTLDAGMEVDSSNNRVDLPFDVGTSRDPIVGVALAPRNVNSGEVATASITVSNPGPARSVRLIAKVVDNGGVLVVPLLDRSFTPLVGAAKEVVEVPVDLGGSVAGDYRVVAELLDGAIRIASSEATITVLADVSVDVSIASLRGNWFADEVISLDGIVTNRSANASLTGATTRVTLLGAGGGPVWASSATALPFLWMGSATGYTAAVPAGSVAPGIYTAVATVEANGVAVASASTAVLVNGRPLVLGNLIVAGTVPTDAGAVPAIGVGDALSVSAVVRNAGSVTSQAVSLSLALVDGASGAVLQRLEASIGDLLPGAEASRAFTPESVGLPRDVYGLSLVVSHDGISEILATARFRVADSKPPALVIQNLASSMFVRGSVTPVVRATDDYTGTAIVQVSVDGQPPLPLALVSGVALDGLWSASVPLGADGPHALVFSAADVEGNSGLVTPTPQNPLTVQVISDTLLPVVGISGVTEGTCYPAPPVPWATASDLNLAVVDSRLNGAPFVSGTPVSADGDYSLSIQATDRASNQAGSLVHFVVAQTPPRLYIGGAADGAYVAADVKLTVVAMEPHLAGLSVLLNGVSTATTATVTAEGAYTVAAHATNCAGKSSDAALSFTIDKTSPVVGITGVVDGSYYRTDVTPSFTASDANLASVTGTLNGVPFASGAPVSAEGNYLLDVVALDKAGNRTERSVAFIIDRSPPLVTLSGFVEGSYVTANVSPSYSASDANLDRVEATLDGLPFVPGMGASAEGLHVFTVKAYDSAGNETDRTGTFTIDRTPPQVSISGVSDGAFINAPVTLGFNATDANLASVSAMLDGAPFTSGTVVGSERSHLLDVVALDKAGNRTEVTRGFVVDATPPAVALAGFSDGSYVHTDVYPDYTATDQNLVQVIVTLDGAAFTRGTVVGAEGQHVFRVIASDLAGNATDRSGVFTIDITPPVIQIGGVAGGGIYQQAIYPTFGATDLHSVTAMATLDGAPFQSGAAVQAAGVHTLAVTAQDAAGNTANVQVSFTIEEAGGCGREPISPRVPVYQDSVVNCFEVVDNWGDQDLAHQTTVHGGSASIAFNPSDWAGLKLGRSGLRSRYKALEFWVHGGTSGGQMFKVDVFSGGYNLLWEVSIESILGGPIPANHWTKVTLPFRMSSPADDLYVFFKAYDGVQPPIYLDDITLLAETAGICTGTLGQSCADGNVCNGAEQCDGAGTCVRGLPLPVDDLNPCTVDTCDPVTGVSHASAEAGLSCFVGNACGSFGACDGTGTCQPAASVQDVVLYGDAVGACFDDASNGGSYDPFQATVVHSGAHAIRFDPVPWDQVVFNSWDLPASFDGVEFWVHGGPVGGQLVEILVDDGVQQLYEGYFGYDPLLPSIVPGTWQQVRLPFVAASAPGWIRIVFQAIDPVSTMYLDDIRFVRNTP